MSLGQAETAKTGKRAQSHEQLRQAALKAMGLPVLVSRFQLSGAKASEALLDDLGSVNSNAQSSSAEAGQSHTAPQLQAAQTIEKPLSPPKDQSIDSIVQQTPPSQADTPNSAPSSANTQTQHAQAVQTTDANTAEQNAVLADVKALFSNKPAAKAKTETAVDESKLSPVVSDDASAISSAKTGPVDATEPESDATKAPSALKFQHLFYQVDDLLVVIDPNVDTEAQALLDLSSLKLSTENIKGLKQFLHDIYLFSFGTRPSQLLQSQFEWPPNRKMPSAIVQEDMAYSTEQAFIATLAEQQNFKAVMVFSSGNLCSLMSQPAVGDVATSIFELQERPLLVAKPIHFYWQNPQSKAELWQQIQRLQQSLVSRAAAD